MTKFHEGQEVEVTRRDPNIPNWNWRKAKIVDGWLKTTGPFYQQRLQVEFLDGTRAIFDADHIRAVSP